MHLPPAEHPTGTYVPPTTTLRPMRFRGRPGAMYHRMLTEDMDITVYECIFGGAIVAVGPAGPAEDGGFNLRLEFGDVDEAISFAHSTSSRLLRRDHGLA